MYWNEKKYTTELGVIKYWLNEFQEGRQTLVFLPGLTVDHRLFNKQIEYFKDKYNCMFWDAPGHAASRPFKLEFDLDMKAEFLHGIMEKEGIQKPIVIGQSMGGYVGQMLMELYPDCLGGFVSIDSCPLARHYVTSFDIWSLKRTETMYRAYPWKSLLKAGSKGCAYSEYGRQLMYDMINDYSKDDYCKLVGHGFRILGGAYESDRKFEITCPSIMICGEEDKAGFTKKYNKMWEKETGLPFYWIKDAGHNSNTDQPEIINKIIDEFVCNIKEAR